MEFIYSKVNKHEKGTLYVLNYKLTWDNVLMVQCSGMGEVLKSLKFNFYLILMTFSNDLAS